MAKHVLLLSVISQTVNGQAFTAHFKDETDLGSIWLSEDKDDRGVAIGTYKHQNGWAVLRLYGLNNSRPEAAMYAVGFLEGYLTRTDIELVFNNAYDDWFVYGDEGEGVRKVKGWLDDNLAWMRRRARESESEFWSHMSLLLAQLDGIAAGLQAAGSWLTARDMILLNADGDLDDLIPMLHLSRLRKRVGSSALVKLASDGSEIFFGHSTFDHYDMMIRSVKVYDFKLRDRAPVSLAMSSSPGFLSSMDDFIITSKGLAIMETTNKIQNHSLYGEISTACVLTWMRSLVASALADGGAEWVELFSKRNSGTYNNQWMVLDMKKFEPGVPLAPFTFVVMEQLPGYIHHHDMSSHLDAEGYWASYSIPSFPAIYNSSGYPMPSIYKTAPRALMFEKLQGQASDIYGLQRLLRYNDWEHDPLSLGNACSAISSRCDLNPLADINWRLAGAIDAKVSTTAMGLEMKFLAQVGPTTYGQPPFSWSKIPLVLQLPHIGDCITYDFPWIEFRPLSKDDDLPWFLILIGACAISSLACFVFVSLEMKRRIELIESSPMLQEKLLWL